MEGFDPERFLPERRKEVPRFAYIPFGGGPRQCIGNNFALMEALQRECLEEIGLEVEIGDLLFVREYIGKNHEFWEHDADSHQVEFIFDCSIKGGKIPQIGTSPDVDQIDVEWISLQEIMNFRLYPKALTNILVDRQPENKRYLGDVN